ncbi:MAG: hypothetical protein MUC60_10125 [Oscillatoria sp. Prado101]|nr:hypothetical protein [Oscillatoria sp. Prado101]
MVAWLKGLKGGWGGKQGNLRPTGILAGAANLEFRQLDRENRIVCRWGGVLQLARQPIRACRRAVKSALSGLLWAQLWPCRFA